MIYSKIIQVFDEDVTNEFFKERLKDWQYPVIPDSKLHFFLVSWELLRTMKFVLEEEVNND